MITHYRCRNCGNKGIFSYSDGISIYDVIAMLERGHGASFPDCKFDLAQVILATSPIADSPPEQPAPRPKLSVVK